MNNIIWIYTKDIKDNKIIKKFYELNIEIIKVRKLNDKTIYLIKQTDYEKLKKYCVYKFRVYEIAGIKKIKENLYKKRFFVITSILGIIVTFLLSNIIINIEIIHSKEEIRTLLKDELEVYGIKRLTLKKNFSEITKIKSKILENNKEKIEWLEIERKGMKYVVRVEERIVLTEIVENIYCNIIAKKDGHILNFQIEKGVANIKRGSYVKKSDVLISGDILLNEEIVDNVCANGKIYAEVWYNINVELPIYYEKIEKTGKSRINFMVEHDNKENIILKSRIKDKIISSKKIFSILGYNFFIQKEEEVTKSKIKYTEKEVLNEAIKTGLNKLNVSLDEEAEIISQKVLKKSINDSKIYLELFVSVKEDIGMIQKIN